jgi:hypothetical protein
MDEGKKFISIAALHNATSSCFCVRCNGQPLPNWVDGKTRESLRHVLAGVGPGGALQRQAAVDDTSIYARALREWLAAVPACVDPAANPHDKELCGDAADSCGDAVDSYSSAAVSGEDSDEVNETAPAMAGVGAALLLAAVRTCCSQVFQPTWPHDSEVEEEFIHSIHSLNSQQFNSLAHPDIGMTLQDEAISYELAVC